MGVLSVIWAFLSPALSKAKPYLLEAVKWVVLVAALFFAGKYLYNAGMSKQKLLDDALINAAQQTQNTKVIVTERTVKEYVHKITDADLQSILSNWMQSPADTSR